MILRDAGLVVVGPDGASRALHELWSEMYEYCSAVISPTAELFGSEAARAKIARVGRQSMQWWKHICAQWCPFVPSSVPFDVPDRYMDVIGESIFNYKKACVGIASHTLMCHATKVYADLGFNDAIKVNEEALDHFFSFLYKVVPVLFGQVVGAKASASAIWQTSLEGWLTGVPTQRITNRSYA